MSLSQPSGARAVTMATPTRLRPLVIISAISGLYDFSVGIALVLAADSVAALFGSPPPVPPIQSNLNGLFLLAVGMGYWFPYRDPARYRGYLWLMGPFLKGAGAAMFVADYFIRNSPRSFLLFAFSDGVLAMLTLWALRRSADRPVRV